MLVGKNAYDWKTHLCQARKKCPFIVILRGTALFHSHMRDVSHTWFHHQYYPQLNRLSTPVLNPIEFGST
jgi:hypothetical protein